jgi:hypothetical protein
VRSGIFGTIRSGDIAAGGFSFCPDAHNACVPLSVHVCTQHGVNTWPLATKCSPLPFSFRLFACSRCRYPSLRVATRSILIALPEEMGGALGNYIRTIFPSPDAISGYIPQTTTERKGNIKVKYFELNLIRFTEFKCSF